MMQAASTQRQGTTAPSSAHPSVFGIMLRPSCGARDTVAGELGQYRAAALVPRRRLSRAAEMPALFHKNREARGFVSGQTVVHWRVGGK
jgi:hypothetical protein